MEAWWSSLQLFDKILWGVAVFSSVTFLIQMIMTFFGAGDHDISTDHDFDHGDASGQVDYEVPFLEYFTIRNLIAFMLGFSWGGLVFVAQGFSRVWVTFWGLIIGGFFVVVVMCIMKGLSKLISSGTVSLSGVIGKEGTVSILIPPKMEGQGKVNVSIQGRVMDLTAITKEGDELKRGIQVRIVSLSNDQLVVEKII